MRAARLHGVADLRVEEVDAPDLRPAGDVLLRVRTVGICGSDLHCYRDSTLAPELAQRPLVLGHEFAGVIERLEAGAAGGDLRPLAVGQRVAVDPARVCGRCEYCVRGNPNLCERLEFCGAPPHDGSLREWLHVPARNCFSLPDALSDASGALLEPLGVTLHAIDLARLRVGQRVAILGAGPVGLCLLQVARLAGADPIFVTDELPWRLALAERLGGVPLHAAQPDPVTAIHNALGGHGVDAVIEAAWAERSLQQALEICRPGGRIVLVGIPRDDQVTLSHGTARRKGLTLHMCRRMKHTYPRALRLVERGVVDLDGLISHRFPLDRAPEAFALNAAYADGVVKVIIDVEEESHAAPLRAGD